jgi:hypothetical protein
MSLNAATHTKPPKVPSAVINCQGTVPNRELINGSTLQAFRFQRLHAGDALASRSKPATEF